MSKLVLFVIFLFVSGCTIVGTEDEGAAKSRTEKIREAVLKDQKRLADCYDYELKKDAKTPEGKVVMTWDVDEEGHAQKIWADATSTLKIETLTKCLTDEIREMNFPPPQRGNNLHIRFPFVFKHEGFK